MCKIFKNRITGKENAFIFILTSCLYKLNIITEEYESVYKKRNMVINMNNEKEAILTPVDGQVIALSKTSDPIFSQGTMGEGFGVIPSNGHIVAPVAGKVSMIAQTGHAIGIVTASGLEVLVHMGIDTVQLNGEGFEVKVKPDQEVTAGQEIAAMDLELIKQKGLETTVMTMITNSPAMLSGFDLTEGDAKAGDVVATSYLKQQATADTADRKLTYDELASFIIKNQLFLLSDYALGINLMTLRICDT